jgi:RNA polymerase sigma-70 factor, ECF subfamily
VLTEDPLCENVPVANPVPAVDSLFVEQIRRGDPDATHRFFREYYPSIYRYLLWLTERPEVAEDLTQETVVRAWRHLDRFESRAPLRVWLLRIAHREFLRHLQSKRVQASLEEMGEVVDARTAESAEAVELREVIRKLPVEEGEVVVLHYLQGYDCQEIAEIIRAPVSTVKYRLSAARSHLQRELGEGDLVYLNEPAAPMRQWAWLPLDQMRALEARLVTRAAGDREAPRPGASEGETMERREFLRHAAVGGMGLMLPESEKDVVDSRLTRKVTLAFKGTALADVCEHLRAETGIHLAAGPSVSDEKVTLFCQKLPLRDVMRQLSRPFGYTWVRSMQDGAYRYELMQDLRSQLLEEELRNRDRHAALLALEKEIERYRPYLHLSPDEALARAKTAPPAEKKLLEKLAGVGWGIIQMYFRLSPDELAALRSGRGLVFDTLKPGEMSEWINWERDLLPPRMLPPDVAHGVLQSWRDLRLARLEDGFDYDRALQPNNTEGLPLTAIPEARAVVFLRLSQTELGQFAINGSSGFATWGKEGRRNHDGSLLRSDGPYAVGQSPRVLEPENAQINARLAGDPGLRARVAVLPLPSCPPEGALSVADARGTSEGKAPEPGVTTADVLEMLHRATGFPIVADFYTRIFAKGKVSVREQPLFDALNTLGDAMRIRWNKEDRWLQFRSISYYDDRLKEVSSRLLSRWAATRRQRGALRVEDLIEIAQLSDAQLDAAEMAEGARQCWGLAEWGLAGNGILRPHLRYLAEFTPAQRDEAMSPAGLPLMKMSLVQQQGFLALGIRPAVRLESMEDLAGAVLRVDYRQPGEFRWQPPGWLQWFVPFEPGPSGRRALTPPIQGRTREAALQALREMDPRLREAVRQAAGRFAGPGQEVQLVSEAAEIVPTELDLVFVYMPGATNKIAPILYGSSMNWNPGTW